MLPMILVITFLIYLGLELTPGDAVSHLIPPDAMANISPEQLAALRDAYGLNDPFLIRYFRWLFEMLKGNFGFSITSGVKISDIVARNLSSTVESFRSSTSDIDSDRKHPWTCKRPQEGNTC